jgi:hypothetical protein
MNERVKLAVFAAGVHSFGKLAEEVRIVRLAGKGGIEKAWIDTHDDSLEARSDKLAREFGGVAAPEREERAASSCRKTGLSISPYILEEQVAVGDLLDPTQAWCCEGLSHPGVIELVSAAGRDQDFDEGQPKRVRLTNEQLAANSVHADPLIRVRQGRYQNARVNGVFLAEDQHSESRVFTSTPGQSRTPS